MRSAKAIDVGTILREWPLGVSAGTTLLFALLGGRWLADLSNPWWYALMFGWLFAVILLSAFALVRHAESLAVLLGEPFGTLVLTLAVTGLEAAMIAAVMYAGPAESAVARDTMFAVIMIVLNGLVGACLLFGGLRYREQTHNLYGANSFLAVIMPLAVLGLIVPTFTTTTAGNTSSPLQSVFLIAMSVVLYCTFLAMQTRWHREYFMPPQGDSKAALQEDAQYHGAHEIRSATFHSVLLLAYAGPVLLLAKQLAIPIEYGITALGAPPALGGFLVAALILSPESLAAVRAARSNHLQRSINLALGSVLASISLTIPAVLIIGFAADKTIILGLEPLDMILLGLTLLVSMVTLALEKTNVLLGTVHLLIFCSWLMLLFER